MRCVALFLLCALIAAGTAGCSLQLEENHTQVTAHAPEPEDVDLTPRRRIEPVLYFLNQNQTRLTAESRVLELGQNESPELAIVRAMLAGPESSDLRGLGAGLTALNVEVMPDLVSVYLGTTPESAGLTDRQLTVAKLAIAAALSDYSGSRYVNVMVDGVQVGFTDTTTGTTIPTGALARSADLADELSTLEQRAAASSFDLYAALYFLDPSEMYLLPQVRRVTFEADRMPQTLISALLDGPDNGYSYSPCIDAGIELRQWETVALEEGTFLRLVFNRTPVIYTSNFVDGELMSAAALTYTFTQFLPGLDGIQIAQASAPDQFRTYRPQQFAELIGNRITIYLPNTPEGMTLTGVDRVIPQAETSNPSARLRMLFRGPVETDTRDVWPAAPEGVSEVSILDAYIAGEIAVVNLDPGIAAVLEEGSAQDERVLVFSVVNTLTDMNGVRRVLFLIDGERREYLGLQAIAVLDPLMRNPGIIK